jgi:Spy/CpxP family protein refolding chaperone
MTTKSIILALTTLIVGFLLGMLTSSQLRSQRLKPVRLFFSEERFKEGMYEAIQPTKAQKAQIDKILDKYSKLNSEASAAFRREFEVRMENFRNEIGANLTPEQIVRLKGLDEQRQEMSRPRGRGRGERDERDERNGYGRHPNSDRANTERHDSTRTNPH